MTRTQEPADRVLSNAERRHLLRRLAFAATPGLEEAMRGLPADDALSALVRAARDTPHPERPEAARGVWSNPGLRFAGVSDEDFEAMLDRLAPGVRDAVDDVRRWWLAELLTSPAPLRENLVLFLHGVFGSNTESVDVPQALHARNALLRRRCLGTVPDLLAALVVDPAMMIQIGMDGHRRLRVSDRAAKLVLDHWTVGEGAYEPHDLEELSRALTGWRLVAPEGRGPAREIARRAPRAARRTGLVPTFRPADFDAGPKTILGRTRPFDARSAVRWLAAQEATGRRFGRLLLSHLGVEDAGSALELRLAAVYRATGGSLEALLREVVRSEAFWSEASRWALIKSPVHLAAGACRQLGLASPPVAEIARWLRAGGRADPVRHPEQRRGRRAGAGGVGVAPVAPDRPLPPRRRPGGPAAAARPRTLCPARRRSGRGARRPVGRLARRPRRCDVPRSLRVGAALAARSGAGPGRGRDRAGSVRRHVAGRPQRVHPARDDVPGVSTGMSTVTGITLLRTKHPRKAGRARVPVGFHIDHCPQAPRGGDR